MTFDIVISNPPYQEETGSGTIITGKKPIYQNFILLSLAKSSRLVCSIIPSRWAMRGVGLESLYDTLENYKDNFRSITDYQDWDNEVFGNQVSIAGGIMYFLLDKAYNGKCKYTNVSKAERYCVERRLNFHPTFIRNNRLERIVEEVSQLKEDTLNNYCIAHPFSLESYERGTEDGNLELLTSSGWFRIQRQKISIGADLINKNKLAISGTTSSGGKASQNGDYKVLASLIPLNDRAVCTNTYIVICIPGLEDIDKLIKYLQTKFVRALIFSVVSSMHIIPFSFIHVPIQDFSIDWTDEQLYKKYKLSEDDISYIERTIRKWEKD